MAKPNKKAIAESLAAWAKDAAKIRRIEAARDALLEPFTAAYERKCAPIQEAANASISLVQARMKEREAEITREMNLGIDAEAKTIALAQVTAGKGVVEVQAAEGCREIEPEKFFKQTPPARRDSAFWQCVKILIGPSEKFLGKTVDVISTKPWIAKVVVKLKD